MSLIDVLDSIDASQIETNNPVYPIYQAKLKQPFAMPGVMQNQQVSSTPTNQQPAFEHSGYTTKTQEPYTSTTVTETDYSSAKSRPEWAKMTGQENWDEYSRRLGISPPEKPVNDENRERRLRTQGLLKDFGNGLFTFGEAIGLGQGASVRQRNIQQAPELAKAEALREQYPEQVAKWKAAMQNYYKQAQDYEKALNDKYGDYLKSSGVRISTKTDSGGGSRIDEYKNPEIEARKHKQELEKIRTRESFHKKNNEDKNSLTHPLGDGRIFKYDYSKAKDSLRTAANNARIGIGNINLPEELKSRIEASVKGGDYTNVDEWKDSDNISFVTKTIEELILYMEKLDNEIDFAKKLSTIDNLQSERVLRLTDERDKVVNALNNINNSGFEFEL